MAYCPTMPADPVTASVDPAGSASRSSAARTVRPFIGSVAASVSDQPSGTAASWSASTTRYSACAPPPGAIGATAAITRSPACQAGVPGPASSMTPARSMPGMYGGSTPGGSGRPP